MKKIILSIAIILPAIAVWGQADHVNKKTITKAKISRHEIAKKKEMQPAVALLNSTNHQAYRTEVATNFYIADPTIQRFNSRAFNEGRGNGRAIIGIPKIRTGVAHGHLLFYSTNSATPGTNTGTGTVGSGSSLGNVGTNGAGMGVNGKSPNAGPGIYGTRVLSDLRPESKSLKPIASKKE